MSFNAILDSLLTSSVSNVNLFSLDVVAKVITSLKSENMFLPILKRWDECTALDIDS